MYIVSALVFFFQFLFFFRSYYSKWNMRRTISFSQETLKIWRKCALMHLEWVGTRDCFFFFGCMIEIDYKHRAKSKCSFYSLFGQLEWKEYHTFLNCSWCRLTLWNLIVSFQQHWRFFVVCILFILELIIECGLTMGLCAHWTNELVHSKWIARTNCGISKDDRYTYLLKRMQ